MIDYIVLEIGRFFQALQSLDRKIPIQQTKHSQDDNIMAYSTSSYPKTPAESPRPDFYEALDRLTRFSKRIAPKDNVVYQDILKTKTERPTISLAQASANLDRLSTRIYSNISNLESILGM